MPIERSQLKQLVYHPRPQQHERPARRKDRCLAGERVVDESFVSWSATRGSLKKDECGLIASSAMRRRYETDKELLPPLTGKVSRVATQKSKCCGKAKTDDKLALMLLNKLQAYTIHIQIFLGTTIFERARTQNFYNIY